MLHKDLRKLRQEYAAFRLDKACADADPFVQFSHWFDQAMESGLPEPNAMSLATASAEAKPSVRIVLLKELDERGFVFYTNYLSRKGRELEANPHASLLFSWLELQRQIRIEGYVEKISNAESDAYFSLRPRESQLGALVSAQSQPVASRQVLEDQFRQEAARWEGRMVERPAHWGGYRLLPENIEFWQGRINRLHDRLLYKKNKGGWQIIRLSP